MYSQASHKQPPIPNAKVFWLHTHWTHENQTTGVSFKKRCWDIYGFGQEIVFKICVLLMLITNFCKEFKHVNSITSTIHISNTQEGQESSRKKEIHNSQTNTTHSGQF